MEWCAIPACGGVSPLHMQIQLRVSRRGAWLAGTEADGAAPSSGLEEQTRPTLGTLSER